MRDSEKDKVKAQDRWEVAGPPHKQRFVFQRPTEEGGNVWADLHRLFVSHAFRTWLQLATGATLQSVETLLRRFRRGYDYQLAQNYTAEEPRLEATLGLTPGRKQRVEGSWWDPVEEEDDENEDEDGNEIANGDVDMDAEASASNSKDKAVLNGQSVAPAEVEAGGEEIYMAADVDGDGDGDADEEQEAPIPPSTGQSRSQEPSTSNKTKTKQDDPAVYRSRTGTGAGTATGLGKSGGAAADNANDAQEDIDDDDDDDVLHTNPPAWNVLSLVLRDANVLRAVRYRNRHAEEDRWDWSVAWEVQEEDEAE